MPKAEMPMPCMTRAAAVMSVPLSVLPCSSQEKETKTGLELTLLTASTAARASASVTMVSTTKRSTPAASSAAACSA